MISERSRLEEQRHGSASGALYMRVYRFFAAIQFAIDPFLSQATDRNGIAHCRLLEVRPFGCCSPPKPPTVIRQRPLAPNPALLEEICQRPLTKCTGHSTTKPPMAGLGAADSTGGCNTLDAIAAEECWDEAKATDSTTPPASGPSSGALAEGGDSSSDRRAVRSGPFIDPADRWLRRVGYAQPSGAGQEWR